MDLADTANVHHLADTASNLVDKFVPVSFQVCLLLPCMVVTPAMHGCDLPLLHAVSQLEILQSLRTSLPIQLHCCFLLEMKQTKNEQQHLSL